MIAPLIEEVLPHIRQAGGRRLECKSHFERRELHNLLGLLGFQIECELPCYGRDGATYVQFAYLLPDATAGADIKRAEPILAVA